MRNPPFRGFDHRYGETSPVESGQSILEGAVDATICAYSVGFQDKVEQGCNVRGQGEVDVSEQASSHGRSPFNFDV